MDEHSVGEELRQALSDQEKRQSTLSSLVNRGMDMTDVLRCLRSFGVSEEEIAEHEQLARQADVTPLVPEENRYGTLLKLLADQDLRLQQPSEDMGDMELIMHAVLCLHFRVDGLIGLVEGVGYSKLQEVGRTFGPDDADEYFTFIMGEVQTRHALIRDREELKQFIREIMHSRLNGVIAPMAGTS